MALQLPAAASNTPDRQLVLDVSRLIWRVWAGRLPTGIDKVCLAYMDHFGPRSLALVQKGSLRAVLDARTSDRLFALLAAGGPNFRRRLLALLAGAWLHRHRGPLCAKTYLNVGHTGLDAPDLAGWLRRTGMRPIFLIHDLIPITHAHFCRPGEEQRHTWRMRHVLECAAGIIVNSQDTLEALHHFAAANGAGLRKTVVAWLGTDHAPPAPAPSEKAAHPYFLIIGTIEARKNHMLLLRIWERLHQRFGAATPDLLVVGQRGWEADETFAMLNRIKASTGPVRELARCTDSELAGLKMNARALLMPSYVEGFGLPAIEALQCGLPVIASDLGVYREVAGAIPLYLAPTDIDAWESAIIDFMGESTERERQLLAMKNYNAPTWQAHFAKVETFLSELG